MIIFKKGEVFNAKKRINGRFQLGSIIFGMEHTCYELIKLFKYDKMEVIKKCAKKHYETYGSNIYKHPNKCKYRPSPTIYNYVRKPNLKDLGKDFDLPCFFFCSR